MLETKSSAPPFGKVERRDGHLTKLAYDVEKRPFYVTRDGHGKAIRELFA